MLEFLVLYSLSLYLAGVRDTVFLIQYCSPQIHFHNYFFSILDYGISFNGYSHSYSK